MLFNFKLKLPLQCAGLDSGETRDHYVCWFYLTDSEYFIDLGEVKLFQLSPQWMEKYRDVEFVDYQYSRQLEDLFEILPTIASAMPADLYALIETNEKRSLLRDKIVDAWEEESPDDRPWNDIDEKYDNIMCNFISYGSLDSGYLRFKTSCQFFHVDEMIIIQYDFMDEDEIGCPVWSAGKGTHTITYSEFLCEIEDLLNRFFNAMDKQVEMAMGVFSEEALKKSQLISEHAKRKDYFYGIFNAMKNGTYEKRIDWATITENLNWILKKFR